MSAAVTVVDVPTEERRVRDMVERVARVDPRVLWRYSAHSNKRFPLRVYASARREGDGTCRDILVIAVELFNPADNQGNRLVVSADIMDDDGGILEQSPRYEVSIPPDAQLLSDPHAEISAAAKQARAAMKKVDQWLTSQAPMIRAALAQS